MALTLKAAWWGIHSRRPDAVVLMPALAARPGPYARLLMANNTAAFTDGWNLHLYGWAQDFPAAVEETRSVLERESGQRRPLWVTEVGFAEFPVVGSSVPAVLLERQRAFFERATVAAPFCGIAHQLAFVLGAHVEQGHDYGLNQPDGLPRPALETLVQLSRALSDWRPRFELRRASDRATVGWVLELVPGAGTGSREWWILFVSPNRRSDFSLPALDGLPPSHQPKPAPETSHHEFLLRFPRGFGKVRWGLHKERLQPDPGELRFTASAATNLMLWTPARKFSVAGVEWHEVSESRNAVDGPAPRPSPVVVSLDWIAPGIRADKAAVSYRYPPGRPVRLGVRLDNFGPEAVNGHWVFHVPTGWKIDEGVPRQSIQVPAGGTVRRELRLIPSPREHPSSRLPITVTWAGKDRSRDQASAWLAPEGDSAEGALLQRLGDGWQALEADSKWSREPQIDGTLRLRLENARPGVTPGLILPLPENVLLAPNDLLRLRLRTADSVQPFRRRVELVTPDRRVYRHGDDWEVDGRWQSWDFRVGDFTPAFWSRTDPERPSGPEDARYLRLGLFGLEPGGGVELAPVEVWRSGRAR